MAAEWRETTLGDVMTLQRGFDLPEAERLLGPYPVIASTGSVGWHHKAMVRGPGVVIGRSGSLGGGQFIRSDFWPLNTTLWVKDFKGNDPRYCYYLLKSLDLAGFNAGSGVPTLNRNHIHPLLVRIPADRDEQRAIAYVLGALDDKIELNRRMSEALEAVARALFESWFVDFDPVRANAEGAETGLPRQMADLFPERLQPSSLGLIPTGWTTTDLGSELGVLETGARPTGGVSAYSTGVPSIGAESIVGLGVFDFTKTKYIPRDFFDLMKRGTIVNRDVLLYKDGGRPGEFEPHVAMFGDGFPFAQAALNEHVYRLRTRQPTAQNFLYFWLTSHMVMEAMRIRGTGVAVPGLNSTQVRSLPLLVPPPELLGAFDHIVERIVARILLAAREAKTLGTIRDALLPRLISGEVRVAEAERLLEAAPA